MEANFYYRKTSFKTDFLNLNHYLIKYYLIVKNLYFLL